MRIRHGAGAAEASRGCFSKVMSPPLQAIVQYQQRMLSLFVCCQVPGASTSNAGALQPTWRAPACARHGRWSAAPAALRGCRTRQTWPQPRGRRCGAAAASNGLLSTRKPGCRSPGKSGSWRCMVRGIDGHGCSAHVCPQSCVPRSSSLPCFGDHSASTKAEPGLAHPSRLPTPQPALLPTQDH